MIPNVFVLFLIAIGSVRAAEPSAAEISKTIRQAALDPDSCYRVRDLNFTKEDIKFYLTDGYLIFAQPVFGRRMFAVFRGDVDGGDAEVLLMPPHRSERRSLASFAESPNLDEHFKAALFLFSDGSGEELYKQAAESGHKTLDMGALLKDQWTSLARNISGGFDVRFVQDLLSPDPSSGIFFAAISGNSVGNFEIAHDPWNREQIVVGQYTTVGSAPQFDIWTSFESKSIRAGRRAPPKAPFTLTDYRIEASLDTALHMQAVTRAKLSNTVPLRAFGLLVSDKVRIASATIDGKPVEVYDRESTRDRAIRGGGNVTFVLVTSEALPAGGSHQVEMHHEGDVVVPAGNEVYYVASRGNWYPRAGSTFSDYDLTFRYPKNLTLVATGESVEDRIDGEYRISRHKTSEPVRVAGFNLGQYREVKLARAGYSIEVFANKALETTLQPKVALTVLPPAPHLSRSPDMLPTPTPPVRPVSRLSGIAETVAASFEFMRAQFGPPPIKSLTVSPIPGAFGQGFPGLVYLSTLTYLPSDARPPAVRGHDDDIFFSELLPAHEVAHQWWGNLVAPAGYEDEWLMEAAANYAALLNYEKRRGLKALDALLESFSTHLLRKMEDGRTTESAGPITWGLRLQSSQSEGAWRVITYEKGAWIMHMLRRRLGDERFKGLLADVCRKYAHEPITNEQFRKAAEHAMGPKAGADSLADFFESWVYGTGIPALKLNWTLKGKAPAFKVTGTVTQSGVDDDFAVEVPIEIQYAKGAVTTQWVRTSNEPVAFSFNVRQPPARVQIPIGTGVLATRK